MAYEKRKRSANWMISEKSLLVDLVTEHIQVIENKKTDGVTMRKKLAEWAKISDKYNSNTMLSPRTADNLKAQWESLKKTAKKEAGIRRRHSIQTGGGGGGGSPNRTIKDPLLRKILSLITPTSVDLLNLSDSDSITSDDKKQAESLPGEAPANDTIAGDDADDILKRYSSESKAPSPDLSTLEDCVLTENKFPVVLIPTPGSESPNPQAQVGTPSLEKVHQLKGNTVTIQMEHAGQETEEAKQLFDIDMDIKREILKQEKIKTKLLLLEHAAKRREEARQLFDIEMRIKKEILKQEKIKTMLLL